MTALPNEILSLIFSNLSAKDLTICREVCTRWKLLVDLIARSDAVWRDHCERDFRQLYKEAWQKAQPRLLWFHLYRSLSLWQKLPQATLRVDEFAAPSGVSEEIQDFKILGGGIIAVHKNHTIVYYDIETLEKSNRPIVTGEYSKYTENDDFIVIHGHQHHLFVIRKAIQNPNLETHMTFENVKSFMLVEDKVYFVNLQDEIYVCPLEGDLRLRFLVRLDEGVMALGYTNNLHVLTLKYKMYSLIDDELNNIGTLSPGANVLHNLWLYNFLERMDWQIFVQWMFILNHRMIEDPLHDILVVRRYGDVTFVGTKSGVLYIYYKPYYDGEYDFLSVEPVRKYNFREKHDCPVLSDCPILQIDVMETEVGHTVIVAMPRKIALLDFIHTVKVTASEAMLP